MSKYIVCNLPINQNNEIRIAVIGEWQGHHNGAFSLSKDDLEQIKTNFDNAKVDVVIDLDHKTIYEGTGEAYGWIKELFFKEDELWAKVEWLESGLELIKTKKYKYISPVFLPNTIEQVTAQNIGWTLHSAALTNRPFMEELGEIKANNKQNQKKEESMTPEQQKKMDDLEVKVKELEEKLKTKDEDLEKEKEKSVETEVDNAIALNKVSVAQKETLIALGKANPDELKKLLSTMTAITVPNNDMYANNNNQQNNKIDVLKLGGINQ
ncbi:phage protease [Aliarcobacter butzleri]|uniref:phage protease n=1 Tax=Aliarcobacter butzleri TaxID=28197 RepID=UPI001EDC6973|nr:phage protease [Aliarcobacter butzleri]MCG3675590.1 phage protease [Aliarcobacter butzleri]